MLKIKFTNKMIRDVKRMIKRGKDVSRLTVTLDMLASQIKMPQKYNDHALKGEMIGFRECHIEPNWLLIYRVDKEELILLATGTGSHADLFDE
ncbi:MAG: type II toxin-antitoxin system YafQ family toxin [Dehalococcoidia bacterium]|nr:type II toxin-antitoxin system YafQ family toxin [Dehalococcoidia bacterium]